MAKRAVIHCFQQTARQDEDGQERGTRHFPRYYESPPLSVENKERGELNVALT